MFPFDDVIMRNVNMTLGGHCWDYFSATIQTQSSPRNSFWTQRAHDVIMTLLLRRVTAGKIRWVTSTGTHTFSRLQWLGWMIGHQLDNLTKCHQGVMSLSQTLYCIWDSSCTYLHSVKAWSMNLFVNTFDRHLNNNMTPSLTHTGLTNI